MSETTEAANDSGPLDPWRRWLWSHAARLVPGPTQAWSVVVREVQVVLEIVPETARTAHPRLSIALPDTFAGLSIVSAEHALYKKQRVYTGDAELDDAVVMHVPDLGLYGAFDAPTRRLVGTLVGRGVTASGGTLRLEPWASRSLAADEVADTIEGMIALALELIAARDARAFGIAEILENDPNAAVRETYERAFAAAADVRDARAKLRAQGLVTDGSGDRFALLAGQSSDVGLSLSVRVMAFERLFEEFALARVEPLVGKVPAKIGEALVPLVLARAAAEQDPDSLRTCAKILVRLVRMWSSIPVSTALEIAMLVAPMDEAEALDFLATCASRNDDRLATVAQQGLLRMTSVGARELLKRLHPETRARLEDNAPNLAWAAPELVAPVFLVLLQELGDERPKLAKSYLETMAHALERMKHNLEPLTATGRERHAAAVRRFLEADDVELVVITMSLLGEVGDLGDLARLSPLTEGFFRSSRIKDAAKAALGTIRQREAIREETGALALSEHDEGGLAIAGDEPTP